MKPWDDAIETPQLRKLVAAGNNLSEAAAIMGRPRGTVIRRARLAGITSGNMRPRVSAGTGDADEDAARGFPRCGVCGFHEAGRSARLDAQTDRLDTCRFHTALVDGPGVGA